MSDDKCKTELLHDIPESNDKFSGAHLRVAEAIVNLIQKEKEGITIGLEGKWGAGKSTVINLIANKLTEEQCLFYFDTWAHQGDPLRRILLERLVAFFKKQELIHKDKYKYWDDKLDELSGKTVVTRVEKSVRLKPWGIAIALSLLLTPIGMALLGNGLKTDYSLKIIEGLQHGLHVNWEVAIGALLSILPLLVTFLKYGITGTLDDILSKEPDTTTISTTNANIDATSIEFENSFYELIPLLEEQNKKLIFVLDNLDRIEPEEALSVLSTVQTFIQFSQYDPNKEMKNKNIWVIIPYDPDGFASVWTEKEKNPHIYTSMLDKKFQIRFTVPPVLLSDWSQFFINQLEIAFPDHKGEEFTNHHQTSYEVFRDFLYLKRTSNVGIPPGNENESTFLSVTEVSPSPREIKLVINQIGSLHRIWQDQIPIEHMTYFVLFNRYEKNLSYFLLSNKLPYVYEFNNDAEFRSNLATLYFNTDKKLAQQLLLKTPITDALKEGRAVEISELAEKHGDCFFTVLESIKVEQEFNIDALSNAIDVLNTSLIAGHPTLNRRLLRFLKTFNKAINTYTHIRKINEKSAKSLIQLSDITMDEKLIPGLLNLISAEGKVRNQASLLSVDEISNITNAIMLFFENAKSNDSRKKELTDVYLPVSDDLFHLVCYELYRFDNDLWKKIKIISEPIAIYEHFKGLILKDEVNENYDNSLEVVITNFNVIEWDGLLPEIKKKLSTFSSLPVIEIGSLISSLIYLSTLYAQSTTIIEELVNSGPIFSHLYRSSIESEENAFTLAVCIYAILMIQSPLQTAAPNPGAVEGYQFLQKTLTSGANERVNDAYCKLVIKYKRLDLLIRIDSTGKSFVQSGLIKIYNDPEGFELFLPEIIISNWQVFEDYLESEFPELIKKTRRDIIQKIISNDFEISKSLIYQKIIKICDIRKNDKLILWILKGLQTASRDVWVLALESNDNFCRLFLFIIDNFKKIRVKLGAHYLDAILTIIEKCIKTQLVPIQPVNEWNAIINTLDTNSRLILKNKVISLVKNNILEIPNLFFDYFSEEISDTKVIKEDTEFVLGILTPIIESKNSRGLKWIADLFERNPDLVSFLKQNPYLKDFKERLRLFIQEGPNQDDVNTVQRIERCLKIRKRK